MIEQVPAITVSDLHVIFRRRRLFKPIQEAHVLKGISFTLNKGEAMAVIGLNGAGKSTLLRVMDGILMPDSGSIVNHGVTTSLLNFSGGLFPECSGRDNIIMGLMLQQNLKISEAEQLVGQVASYAELEDHIDAPMKTYSSGMLTRLKFAVAMQATPDVLLVDEVLAVGDFPFRQKSMASMREKLTSGETIVFVTHALNEVREFCTRAIWIEDGRLVADGPAKDIVKEYSEYASTHLKP